MRLNFHRLTLSKLGLAHQCLYGFRADVIVNPRKSGHAAKIGSITHSIVECAVNGTELDPTLDPSERAEAQAIFDGPLKGFVASQPWTICESGFAFQASTNVVHDWPRRGQPGYERTADDMIAGTLDLASIEPDFADVIDVKTGKPPADAEQLYGQAVMVSRRYKVPEVRVRYARALKTKLEMLNDEVLDADRLDAEAGRITRLLRMLPDSKPNEGEWCWRCDAWLSCPAKQEARDQYNDPMANDPPESIMYDDSVRLF